MFSAKTVSGDDYMTENDTVKLLRECDSGIKMGISTIDGVMDTAKNAELRDALDGCRTEHLKMKAEIAKMLADYGDLGKEPSIIAKEMSKVKTEAKLCFDESDKAAAELITDGCNMGVKSLSGYLNKYKAADEDAKTLARRLISSEEQLAVRIRKFL